MSSGPNAAQIQEMRERLHYDTPLFAEHCIRILDKQRQSVPLVAHPWQLELDRKLEEQRAAGKPMRAIILKARKLGMSTWIAMKMLQRVTQEENRLAVVVAQDIKTAGAIFDMALFAYSNLPSDMELHERLLWGADHPTGLSVRPEIASRSLTRNGRMFLAFGERSARMRLLGGLGTSTFEIDTANAPDSGRGTTPSYVHMSEVGWWEGEAAQQKIVGLLNAVPQKLETLVVLESTANGMNHFHKRWISARDGAEDPDSGETYVPIFVPWWRDTELVEEFPSVESRSRFEETVGRTDMKSVDAEITEDEPMLQELYGCSLEQLAWRRMMIRTQHENSVELFKQENPASDEEAFIGSGRTVFSSISVAKAIRGASEATEPVRGSLRASELEVRRSRLGNQIEVPSAVEWAPPDRVTRHDPELLVWEHPAKAGDPGHTVDGAYVVAVDFAEGIANTFSEGDYHAIQVFDHRTRMQVAVHESRMDIAEIPLWVMLIALYYNQAWLVPEINGPGIAPVDVLQKELRYPRIFRRRQVGTLSDTVQERPGWQTNRQTKPILEQTMAAALAEGTHGLRHVGTARQLNSYVVDGKGKHGALAGEHDDLLMAAMIGQRAMDLLKPPTERKQQRKPRRMRDDVTGY